MTDLYEILGVPKDATDEQIKAAYRRLAQRYHPDLNQGEASAGAEAMFKEAKEAYEVLSDLESRLRYDETGSAEQPESPDDAEARKALEFLFGQALEQDGEVILAVTNALQVARARMAEDQAKTNQTIARLRSRCGRVKVKRGTNIVQVLIDRRICDCEARLELIDKAMRVNQRAQEMLADYEGEPWLPQAPQQSPRSDAWTFVSLGSLR